MDSESQEKDRETERESLFTNVMWTTLLIHDSNGNGIVYLMIFKPPPPVGAGGGYVSGRPCVPLSVRASVRPSLIHVVVLCFRDISSIC